jgi:hypothetical protein
VDTYETVGQDAALKECAELAFDETRSRATALQGACEKRFEFFADDLVKNRVLRFASCIAGCGIGQRLAPARRFGANPQASSMPRQA